MARIRRPSQAGTFYEGTADLLREQIKSCFFHRLGPGKDPASAEKTKRVLGLICPHAGYAFSGPIAAHAYYELARDGAPKIIAIMGPNHTGYGSALATMNEGSWQTPLGNVEIDSETANLLARESRIIDIDETAHRFEHSIEVQLPFLQYLYGSTFRFVPICFLMQDLTSAREVGEALATILRGKNAVVIASSDMTHYEPQESAKRKDVEAIRAIEAMDEREFFSITESKHVTACGYGPIAALITSTKLLGCRKAKLLCYKTSGDVIGDYSSVVGYAALSFEE